MMFPVLLLAFVPMLQDSYDTGRWIIVSVATLLLLLWFLIQTIRTKKIIIGKNAVSLGFLSFTIASLISLIVASTNKFEALTHPLGLVTYACLFFIALLLPAFLSKEKKRQMVWVIVSVIGFLGLIVLYQQFQITSLLFPGVSYLKSNLWNPTGTPISASLLFFLGIPLAIHLTRDGMAHHKERNTAFALVAAVLMLAGLVITIWRFLPYIQTVVMPFSIGWTVLLESWKNWKSALVGVGAENYLPAYALGRPAFINQTALWNTGFSTGATFALHIMTTLGFVGFLALLATVFVWFKSMPKQLELKIIWIGAVLALFLLPPSIPFLLGMVLIESALTETEKTHTLRTLPIVGITIGIIGITITSGYFLYRFTMGEYFYAQARTAAETENNLTASYNKHLLAIRQNPFITRYHLSLSQLALAMGGSILQNAPKNDTTGKVTLLDDDKTLVTSLFSLSVNEAKLATSLAPANYAVWTNLGTVYQSLIGVATDAESWTLAAYQKAVTLNPISPTLRVDFGGIYMNTKDYDNAIVQFFTAVTLKPNYANAYYNLANAYKIKGETKQAIDALTQTQNLLAKDSADWAKVTEELKVLQKPQPIIQ